MNNSIIEILAQLPGILIALSFHESAHAIVANIFGDETAKKSGRISLDPIKHVDPLGLLMLLFFKIGWAKPVPVSLEKLKYKKISMILVSLSGPISNIILGVLFYYIYKLEAIYFNILGLNLVLKNIFLVNLWFASFNLLPIPPLDGSKIFITLIPENLKYYVYKYENYIVVFLVFLIFTNKIGIILNPIHNFVLIIFKFFIY